jgi:mitochondrial import receptor subunit TOM70
MSNQPYPVPPSGGVPVQLTPSTSQSSFWDRISTWASENKVVVYTMAGIAIVVTGAGVAYYLTDSVSRIKDLYFIIIYAYTLL